MSPVRFTMLGAVALLIFACAVRPVDGGSGGGSPPAAPPEPGGSAEAPVWPTLAPGAAYTGVPCSGYGGTCVNNDKPIQTCSGYGGSCQSGGAPSARLQAQPALHWIVPSDQRLVSDKLICVDADAKGGIANVKFYGEGGTAVVTQPGFIRDTDVNGRQRTRWGYCVRLDAAAWKAKTTTGSARLYAEATANDTRMAKRLIGTALIDVDGQGRSYDTEQYAGNYPMVVYPRTVENDWSKTVCGAGCDYATIKSAIDAAVAADAEAPKITLNATGFYEVESRGASHSGGKGFLTITHAPGVTATLGRAAPYSGSPTNVGNVWTWRVGWEGVEFRGSGIVIDARNFTSMTFDGKSPWFNGIRFTNSIGSVSSAYWNGNPAPEFSTSRSAYWDDSYLEYVSGPLINARYVINTQFKETAGMVIYGTHYTYNNYFRYYSNQALRGYTPVLRIAYGGAGSGSVASTATNEAAGTLSLKVNGSTVASLPLGKFSSDTNPTISALAAAINSYGNGWTATVLNGLGGWRASALSYGAVTPGGSPPVGAFANAPVDATGTDFRAGIDVHAEWSMLYTGGAYGSLTPRQNIIWRSNVIRDFAVGPLINMACQLCYDFVWKNNVVLGTPAALTESELAIVGTYFGGPSRNHIVFTHNTFGTDVAREQVGIQDLLFSEYRNNVIIGAYRAGGVDFSADQQWEHNFFVKPNPGVADMALTGGSTNFRYAADPVNTSAAISAFAGLFQSFTAGNVTPVGGSVLQSNLKPSAETYDQRGCRRDASDYAGAWSKACATLPVYPF
jgi:hypothetical protein